MQDKQEKGSGIRSQLAGGGSAVTGSGGLGGVGGSGDQTEKGFSLLRTDTIQLWVWLQGYQPLEEQSLKSLSEDISYRIREITDSSVNYMHHCKRSLLKTADLNRSFQLANIEKTFGYSTPTPFAYNAVDVAGLSGSDKLMGGNSGNTTLFELKDDPVELKLPDESCSSATATNKSTTTPQTLKTTTTTQMTFPTLHGKWLVVNGNYIGGGGGIVPSDPLSTFKNLSNDSQNFSTPMDEAVSWQSDAPELNMSEMAPLNETYRRYYDTLTSIVLAQYGPGSTVDDTQLLETILEDLKSNSKLQPVLPYIINFVNQTCSISSYANYESAFFSEMPGPTRFATVVHTTGIDYKLHRSIWLNREILHLYKTQTLTNSVCNQTSSGAAISLAYLHRVLLVLKHLILNKNVFLAPKGFFSKVLSCLLYCALQHNQFVHHSTDGLALRENAAFLLVMFLKLYERFSMSTIRYLTSVYFRPHLRETARPQQAPESACRLYSIYGIVHCLINFGGLMIDDFQPLLAQVARRLDSVEHKSTIESLLLATCLSCFVVHLKWLLKKCARYWNRSESKSGTGSGSGNGNEDKDETNTSDDNSEDLGDNRECAVARAATIVRLASVCAQVQALFGDALTLQLLAVCSWQWRCGATALLDVVPAALAGDRRQQRAHRQQPQPQRERVRFRVLEQAIDAASSKKIVGDEQTTTVVFECADANNGSDLGRPSGEIRPAKLNAERKRVHIGYGRALALPTRASSFRRSEQRHALLASSPSGEAIAEERASTVNTMLRGKVLVGRSEATTTTTTTFSCSGTLSENARSAFAAPNCSVDTAQDSVEPKFKSTEAAIACKAQPTVFCLAYHFI